MKRYYYLYTSIPDVALDMGKKVVDLKALFELFQDELLDDDFNLIRNYLFRFDNENIIKVIEKSEEEFNSLAYFSKEQCLEEYKIPTSLPNYLKNFIDDYKSEQLEHSALSLRDQLAVYYYKYLMSSNNEFMKKFTDFDFNLNNVLVALNCKKYNLERQKNILPLNEEASYLINSNASDFGLSTYFPWLSDVIGIYESGDFLTVQKELDKLRFDFIDSLLTFEYFSAASILGYFVKCILVERWLNIEPDKGKEFFNRLTDGMTETVEVSV